MKIYKIAEVADFMTGVSIHDLSKFPEESELSKDQMDEIKSLTLNMRSTYAKLPYFLKYPKQCYFGMYDVSSAYSMSPEKMEEVWKKFKIKYPSPSHMSLASPLPDFILQDLLTMGDEFLSPDMARDIFSGYHDFPEFYVEGCKRIHPQVWNAFTNASEERGMELTKAYLEFPTNMKRAEILTNNMVTEYEKSLNDDKMRMGPPDKRQVSLNTYSFCCEQSDFIEKGRRLIVTKARNSTNHSSDYDGIATDLMNIAEAYTAGENFIDEDSPFSLVCTNSEQFGLIRCLFLGDVHISYDFIVELSALIRKVGIDQPIWLNWGVNTEYSNSAGVIKDVENTGVDISSIDAGFQGIMVIINYEKAYPVGKIGESISYRHDLKGTEWDNKNHFDAIAGNSNLKPKEEVDSIMEWALSRVGDKNADDHVWLSVLQSTLVKNMTMKAGSDLFSVLIQSNQLVSEEEYNRPDFDKHYSMTLPFNSRGAMQLWNMAPQNVIRAAKPDEVGTWFYLLSGVFPCDRVYEQATKSLSDLKKVVNNLSCSGGSNEVVNAAKKYLEQKENEVRSIVKEKLPQFLASDNVRQHHIADFPDLFAYAEDVLRSNMSDKKMYDHDRSEHVPGIELALKQLKEVNIYFIDAGAYKTHLGDEGQQLISASPDNASGFYAPAHSDFGKEPTVVIFTNGLGSITADKTLEALGISANSNDLSISEEGTLWHEVAHAIMDKVIGITLFGKDAANDHSAWLTSPDEILAISYGNLKYMKKIISDYFESIYPFPDRINSGLLNQMKTDIIKQFGWEFQGMKQDEALATLARDIPEFDAQTIEGINAMSKEEQLSHVTYMFTEFFMRKYMRSKAEDEIETMMKDAGKQGEKIEFGGVEAVVPEPYNVTSISQRDKFISNLETRDDYKQFLQGCQKEITKDFSYMDRDQFLNYYRGYVFNNNVEALRRPFVLADLLLLMFGAPATIDSVNIESTNSTFSEYIPSTLLEDVKKIVEDERLLNAGKSSPDEKYVVTPDEAEEAGKFITEMDEDYGRDWMWLAKTKHNWYKLSTETKDPFDKINKIASLSSEDTQMLEQMGYSKRDEAFYGDYELYVFEATGQIANFMDESGLPKYQLAMQRIDTDFTNIEQQEQANPPVGTTIPMKEGMTWLKDTIELWLGNYGAMIGLSHNDAKNRTYRSVLKRLGINFTEKDVPDFVAGGNKKAIIIQ